MRNTEGGAGRKRGKRRQRGIFQRHEPDCARARECGCPWWVRYRVKGRLYREKVGTLARALEHPETRTQAAEVLRGLIEGIVLTPSEGGELRIELKGNLAAMLSAAQNAKRSPETGDLSLQVAMVAGAGFEPATFGL